MNFSSGKMLHLFGYIFYTLGTKSYFFLVWCLAPLHKRAKLLLLGQSGLLDKIIKNENEHKNPCIWFHVSSLGEFEQGKPVMEALKLKYPDHRLVLTFFSPSGYEARKNESLCDAVYYLPFESKKNARILIDCLNPSLAFWVKYDFWYEYIHELKRRNIPVFLLAAQFRSSQIFFKPYGKFKRDLLGKFTYIFCQNENSLQLLQTIEINNSIVTGDNRFDRVFQTSKFNESVPFLSEFCANNFVLIAGSSYAIEESYLKEINWKNNQLRLVIAPHFVDEGRIKEIENTFPQLCIRYSHLNNANVSEQQYPILIIDSIGWLSRLYKYGHAAIIGGGFVENGLHNCLEAAAFGMPICFGPKIKRFPEAQLLVEEGIATTLHDRKDFIHWFQSFYQNRTKTKEISEKSRQFVANAKGATEKVLAKIPQYLN